MVLSKGAKLINSKIKRAKPIYGNKNIVEEKGLLLFKNGEGKPKEIMFKLKGFSV